MGRGGPRGSAPPSAGWRSRSPFQPSVRHRRDLSRARRQPRWPARRRRRTERRSAQGTPAPRPRRRSSRPAAGSPPRSQLCAKAEAAAKAPLTTAYTPRPLEFPRAKTTYRDTPSNAPYSKVSTGRRLALARWIVDRRNPLTARVAVNHVWARHFGEPLVASMYDFGLRTPRPEHHELLDWLAVEFMESGWSFKHLHRLIVTSQAYRMRSSESRSRRPECHDRPRQPLLLADESRRMEGEVVRDSVLFLAGRLDPRMGGPGPAGRRRRGRHSPDDLLPLCQRRQHPVPDHVRRRECEECYRRHETIVPQQALAMTNSGMVSTRAGEIAAAIDREVGSDASCRSAFVDSAFERILGRVADRRRARRMRWRAWLAWLRCVRVRGEQDPADAGSSCPRRRWCTCC